MISVIENITYILGRAICHQLPERSIMIDGNYLAVCARDTGIYIGIFSSLLYLMITKKYKSTTIPNVKISLLLLLLLIPLIFDGLSSYTGLYSTTNLIRISTGILFGITLPFFLSPLLHHSPTKEDIPVLTKTYELLIPLILSVFLAFLIYKSLLPFVIIQILIIGTLLFWIALLCLLFFKRYQNKYFSICLSLCSSFMILSSLSYVHSLVRPFYLENL